MTANEVLDEIQPLGTEGYRKILLNHGVPEPCFGVKIEDLKKIQKRIKKDYQLALDLYDTGIYDAMYLAGLIADDAKMTKKDLRRWVEKAHCAALCEYTVPWVAAGEPARAGAGPGWIESKRKAWPSAGLGDAERPGGDQGRRRPRPRRAEATAAARAEDDPRAAEPRPLRR